MKEEASPKDNADDGVKKDLEIMTATMHTISSKPPVPIAELEMEGTFVKALLDTGSTVTIIVSLEFQGDVNHPAQWKKEVNQRLQPTQVSLRNNGVACGQTNKDTVKQSWLKCSCNHSGTEECTH